MGRTVCVFRKALTSLGGWRSFCSLKYLLLDTTFLERSIYDDRNTCLENKRRREEKEGRSDVVARKEMARRGRPVRRRRQACRRFDGVRSYILPT